MKTLILIIYPIGHKTFAECEAAAAALFIEEVKALGWTAINAYNLEFWNGYPKHEEQDIIERIVNHYRHQTAF